MTIKPRPSAALLATWSLSFVMATALPASAERPHRASTVVDLQRQAMWYAQRGASPAQIEDLRARARAAGIPLEALELASAKAGMIAAFAATLSARCASAVGRRLVVASALQLGIADEELRVRADLQSCAPEADQRKHVAMLLLAASTNDLAISEAWLSERELSPDVATALERVVSDKQMTAEIRGRAMRALSGSTDPRRRAWIASVARDPDMLLRVRERALAELEFTITADDVTRELVESLLAQPLDRQLVHSAARFVARYADVTGNSPPMERALLDVGSKDVELGRELLRRAFDASTPEVRARLAGLARRIALDASRSPDDRMMGVAQHSHFAGSVADRELMTEVLAGEGSAAFRVRLLNRLAAQPYVADTPLVRKLVREFGASDDASVRASAVAAMDAFTDKDADAAARAALRDELDAEREQR